jgi:hypothetical protein
MRIVTEDGIWDMDMEIIIGMEDGMVINNPITTVSLPVIRNHDLNNDP